jgi:dTDP-4-amino-4,6-dideoxygalactose transaminase
MRLVPLSRVRFGHEEEDAVLAVLRSGQIAQGPAVARFEGMVAAITGTRHCVAVSNGTVALEAALRASGVGPGDEVITSPFTFVATLNAILAVGATARFADIDADDFLMRADAAAALVNARTRAIVVVHLYGQMADMAAFAALAGRHGLVIIEDAAQALGATQSGRAAGSFGTGCLSFYATKNVTTGEGGAITTDDDALAESLRLQRNQGMRSRHELVAIGSNQRMTDLQAAIGIPQLARIQAIGDRRRANAAALDAALGRSTSLRAPIVLPGNRHVYHHYTTRVLPESGLRRDDLARQLQALGVETGVFYRRTVFDHDCFRGHPGVAADPCPVAAAVVTQALSLPVHHHLSASELDQVCSAVAGISA